VFLKVQMDKRGRSRRVKGDGQTHSCLGVKHALDPLLALLRGRTDDLGSAELELSGLTGLVDGGHAVLELVECEVLDELGPGVGRAFMRLDEVLYDRREGKNR
jgi:hypothetical protein